MSRLLPTALVLALAAGSAAAEPAPLYRSVGPDGKITFSDRRPTDAQLQTREMGKGPQYRALFSPGVRLFETPQEAAASARRFRTPPSDGLVAVPSRVGRPFPPGLTDAVLVVTGHRFFVQVLLESCARAAPAGLERYQVVVRNWRDRNADVFAKVDRITFSDFTGEQRDQLRYAAQAALQPLLPRPGAEAAETRAWCDGAATDLTRHQHELDADPRVAPALDYTVQR